MTISTTPLTSRSKSSANLTWSVITDHVAKDGTPKIVAECDLPLTGRRVVHRIITDLAVFDRMHKVSLRGHLLCSRVAIPEMLKAGGGAIVYTSSGASKGSAPMRVSYYIAKAGLNGLMRHVADRWGKEGIRANCVCPGVILTDAILINTSEDERAAMLKSTPSTRHGSEEDVASLVSFLLSDEEAGWINGQAVNLNGGGLMAV